MGFDIVLTMVLLGVVLIVVKKVGSMLLVD